MPTIKMLKQDGTSSGEVTLNDSVFGIEPNDNVVFDAVIAQQSRQRQGTHAVKNRSERRGGGRKPWRQKGTGRARSGSTRSPIWRGGGIVFGPTPRSYGHKLPRKARRLAIKSVLSQKVLDEEMILVDSLALDIPKTKEFKAILDNLEVDKKVLVVLDNENDNIYKSARNIANVKVVSSDSLSVLDAVSYDYLLITQTALEKVEGALK
ncbi:MAG: 50S ribosomal protein L4 [Tetragenococcus koreensis]|nr:50S ribosomal protein L4 [Atopostipes suicloacalis]MDN6736253.1 50S ribosomal protein L4 [Tetragenococcus koreensis]